MLGLAVRDLEIRCHADHLVDRLLGVARNVGIAETMSCATACPVQSVELWRGGARDRNQWSNIRADARRRSESPS